MKISIIFLLFLLSSIITNKCIANENVMCYSFSKDDSLFPRMIDCNILGVDFYEDKEVLIKRFQLAIDNCSMEDKNRKLHLYYVLERIYAKQNNLSKAVSTIEQIVSENLFQPCEHSSHIVSAKIGLYKNENKYEEGIALLTRLKNMIIRLFPLTKM